MGGKCIFRSSWMQVDCYKEWLQCDVSNRHLAKCKLCNKSISISKMGEAVLKSHMKSDKHTKFLKILQSTPSTSIITSTAIIQNDNKKDLEVTEKQKIILQSYFQKNESLDAEILWTLKTVKNHHSYKSNENIENVFKKMFPDSAIAANFSCGERKSAYYAVFGIAPHFKNMLLEELKSKECYILLFDESLNNMNQMKQLDLHVRFWNENTVKTMFLTSVFLGHATAEDLYKNIQSAILPLKMSNIIQISMDGPNVNWKLYGMIQEDFKTQYGKQLINTGSCGLHVIHNAFREGFESSDWDISIFLSCTYSFFKDSPARREDYSLVAGGKFPLKFVNHRWVENVAVCERAIEIVPYLKIYVENIKKGKLKEPACKSFIIMKNHLDDSLLTVKLNIFLSVAKIFQPFLSKYQTDKPMMPFLAEDIKKILILLMQCFIKPCVIENVTMISLFNIDYRDVLNHCKREKIDLGFVAERKVKELRSANKISDYDLLNLRSQFKSVIIKMLSKLLLKSPITYSIVRNLSCLNPNNMARNKQLCIKKMRLLLVNISSMNLVNASECDEIIAEFSDFLNTVVSENSIKFLEFDHSNSNLDTFYAEFMKCNYTKLWSVTEKLLLLSHGQGTVERGFSINKKIEVENMKEHSYIAHRVICDHLNNLGGDITKVIINKDLRASVSCARQRYSQYLEEEKRKASDVKRNEKRYLEEREENELKKQKKILEKNIQELLKSADEYAERAEKQNNLLLITKSNSLRHTAKQKQEELLQLGKKH